MHLAPYDIGEEKLAWAIARSPFPKRLLELVDLSRRSWGWFSSHLPRSFEYPWAVSTMGNVKGTRILDLGAGVSPLPLFLALDGASVVTVDNSPFQRNLKDSQQEWNEWGYVDYGLLHPGILSLRSEIQSCDFNESRFNFVYSISVIEHLLACQRRDIWKRVLNWLAPQGVLLLTVDLVPDSFQLWDWCNGQIVEPPEDHGDAGKLMQELEETGFRILQTEFIRDLPDTRVDCLCLECIGKI